MQQTQTGYKELTNKEMEIMMVELREDANHWMEMAFDMSVDIPIKLNGRLTRTFGKFISRRMFDETRAVEIHLSKEALRNGYEAAWEVLKHELVHYGLFSKRLPFRDSDDYFIDTCAALEVCIQGEIELKRRRVIMECAECGYEWTMNRRKNGYTHNNCGGKLVFKEHRVV